MPSFDRQSAFAIFVLFLVVVLAVCYFLPKQEKYGSLMGALSKYKDHYVDALDECERGDFTLFQGEPACSRWVNSQYSKLYTEGKEPSMPRDTSYTRARKFCGGNRQCIDDYFSQLEMNKWCAQKCQWKYGGDTVEQCKDSCFKTLLPNISSMSAWTYD